MGIQGIYGEIGPGQRVALSKLAIECFEKTGRPLRIAVDVSIWQFQIQSGKGGSNPALRTLYYRLLRLLSMSIQPIFVFDGSQKPPFKRNKRIGVGGPSLADYNTKQLLKLFGFPFHSAPGEAEAECALLQREGLVDAVLSEDVDTLMFGCGRTLRNWSSEGSRGNHAPTHVTVYDAEATKGGKSGLDRQGMILVALMSGGDYITEGIPGCGIKVACEAARAGFGKALCKLSRADATGLKKWRENLLHELQTNESKYFRIKHKALQISESFPNRDVLGYYTHPIVSSVTKLTKLKEDTKWDGEIDVAALRDFVAEAFGWTHRAGAKKFIRGLAPALLVSKVRARANHWDLGLDDPAYTAANEVKLVEEICGRREHFSMDGTPELRLAYYPVSIVGLDLDAEPDESEDCGRDGLAPLGADENIQKCLSEEGSDDSSRTRSRSPTKRKATIYDPTAIEKVWVPETIAKVGIPLMVEDYEEALRNPRRLNKSKAVPKKTTISGGMRNGALDRYITIVKPASDIKKPQSPKKLHSVLQDLPLAHLAPLLDDLAPSRKLDPLIDWQTGTLPTKRAASKSRVQSAAVLERSKPGTGVQKRTQTSGNPWTTFQSSSPTIQKPHMSSARISKPGICAEVKTLSNEDKKPSEGVPSVRRDFTKSSSPSPSPLEKHSRPRSSSPKIEIQTNSSTISQLASPTKKRNPDPFTSSTLSPEAMKQTKAAMKKVIDVSSSPSQASRSAPDLEKLIEISASRAAQEPTEKIIVAKGKNYNKKFVVLRESLEGVWKEVGQEPIKERIKGRAWRASAVEMLDMTGD